MIKNANANAKAQAFIDSAIKVMNEDLALSGIPG
jgi:hypothetical protein